MKNEFYTFFINKKKQDLNFQELISFMQIKYHKQQHEFVFLKDRELHIDDNNSLTPVSQFLKDHQEDFLLSSYEKLSLTDLHKYLLLNDQLNLDINEAGYQHSLKLDHHAIINQKLFNEFCFQQCLSNTTMKTTDPFLNLTLDLIQTIKTKSHEEAIQTKEFKQLDRKFKRHIFQLGKSEHLSQLNFFVLSAISHPDWYTYLKEDLKLNTQRMLIPLVILSIKNDSNYFSHYLADNEEYYFSSKTHSLHPSLSKKEATLLHFLASHNKTDQMQSLLEKNPTLIDQVDLDHESALFYAIKNKSYQAVDLLVHHNIDLNIENKQEEVAAQYLGDSEKEEELYQNLEKKRLKEIKNSDKKNKFIP